MSLILTDNYRIHSSSDVQSRQIGAGTVIWQFCVVLADARIGSNCNINAFVFIENDVVIGNNVTVKCGVQLWDGIEIHDDVQIGPNVTFSNDRLPKAKQSYTLEMTKVLQGASIGANATICPGITIGKHAMIGAGAVVTRDVTPFAVMVGNPAIRRGFLTAERVRVDEDMNGEDGNKYCWSEIGNLVPKND